METTHAIMRFVLTFGLFLTTISYISATDLEVALKKANKEFEEDHFHNAIALYEDVIKLDPENALGLFRIGVCYLETASLTKSLEFIERAYAIDPNVDRYFKYWHGKALHRNYKFQRAIEEYQFYLDEFKKANDTRRIEIETLIAQAKVGMELYQRPQYFLVENLGEGINSEYHDHSPIVAHDGEMLIFTSQREYGTHHTQDPDGHFYEAIFISHKKDGSWEKPYSISASLESQGHDACIQLFDNETKMLIYKQSHYGDIYVSDFKDNKWNVPVRATDINSNDYEADATITSDGNRIYFSTDKYTKDKNLDIFYSDKTTEGWTKPVALPGSVNSSADENAPYISEDGKTLYFCSNGERSMGGYDVFVSTLNDDGSWSAPENLGYPINSVDNDVYYHPLEGTRYAYFSSYRAGGLGELDIYSSTPIPFVKLNGSIVSSINNKPILNDSIEIFFRSKDDNDFVFASDARLNAGKFNNNLLSHTNYETVIIKGVDTLFKEDLSLALASDDGTEIDKVYIIDYIDSIDNKIFKPDTITPIQIGDIKFEAVYFDYNKAELRSQAKAELDKVLSILKSNQDVSIELAGHTDNVGSQRYNLKLSKKRAEIAYNYLLEKGANKKQLSFVGYGKLKPLVKNDTEENRQKNRRTEIIIQEKK